MADSNITKRALAAALKELMAQLPFQKISVADICEACGMNRKSFYYHFRDKYDLVCWIFDTELLMLLRSQGSADRWDIIGSICDYLYNNRSFYSKAFQIRGQNSLSEHFRELLLPLLRNRLSEIVAPGDAHRIGVDFFADGILCAILRWLLANDPLPAREFVQLLRTVTETAAVAVCREMAEK